MESDYTYTILSSGLKSMQYVFIRQKLLAYVAYENLHWLRDISVGVTVILKCRVPYLDSKNIMMNIIPWVLLLFLLLIYSGWTYNGQKQRGKGQRQIPLHSREVLWNPRQVRSGMFSLFCTTNLTVSKEKEHTATQKIKH